MRIALLWGNTRDIITKLNDNINRTLQLINIRYLFMPSFKCNPEWIWLLICWTFRYHWCALFTKGNGHLFFLLSIILRGALDCNGRGRRVSNNWPLKRGQSLRVVWQRLFVDCRFARCQQKLRLRVDDLEDEVVNVRLQIKNVSVLLLKLFLLVDDHSYEVLLGNNTRLYK